MVVIWRFVADAEALFTSIYRDLPGFTRPCARHAVTLDQAFEGADTSGASVPTTSASELLMYDNEDFFNPRLDTLRTQRLVTSHLGLVVKRPEEKCHA
jgi:hypothetical protein